MTCWKMRRVALALGLTLLAGPPAPGVHAACNLIPPAEQAYPSTLGTVTSPITAAGKPVELRLSGCDASPGFHPTAAQNAVVLTFLPPSGASPTDVPIASAALTVADCAPLGGPCNTLRFTMPATPGLAGAARIAVTNLGAGVEAARIDTLFQPVALGDTCDKAPEGVFRSFTVLPPPNVYADVCSDPVPPCTGTATQVQATLDGSGSLLIPFDYRAVLPLGPGEPVARLLAGTTTIDAFSAAPGVPITLPSTDFVRSFTIDGRPLPPLLRATADGGEVYGASDGAEAIIRVARTDGRGGPAIFDFTDRLSNGGRGPIVIPNGQYTVTSDAAIPLENLRSSATGVAYTRPETLEGDLNGDGDTADEVVQIIDAGTFASTNTGRAATPVRNPLVAGSAVETAGQLAAFLESEVAQGETDLDADGDRFDDILRVFTLGGAPVTPDASRTASPFPGINRRPVAIDGALTYYRTAGNDLVETVRLPNGATAGAVTPDGRLLVTVTTNGLAALQRRDAELGGRDGTELSTTASFTLGAQDVVVAPGSRLAFLAASQSNAVISLQLRYQPEENFSQVAVADEDLRDGFLGTDGLQGVSRLALSPGGEHVYAVAAGDDAVTTIGVDQNAQLSLLGLHKNGVGGVTNMVDPADVVVSPDGRHVYVAVQRSSRIRAFSRNPVTGILSVLADYVDGTAAGGAFLGDVAALAMSPDGRFLYAVSQADDALVWFARDPGSGSLTLEGFFANRIGATDLDRLGDVEVSPDGQMLYVTTGFSQLLVFARTGSGAPVFVRAIQSPDPFFLGAIPRLTISPDSEFVYLHLSQTTPSGFGTRIFRRTAGLRAFDATTAIDRPGLAGANAALAAVGPDRAAYVDPTLAQAVVYDAQTDSLQPIPNLTAAGRIALSSRLLVMTARETTLGDVNGDGDALDDVAVAMDPANPAATQVVIPVQATQVGATDVCDDAASNPGARCGADADCPGGACIGVAAILVAESVSPAPDQFDLNGDGDRNDRVLHLWWSDSEELVNTGLATVDFVAAGNIVAFRADELAQGQADLNFDNDADFYDDVLHAYDLATRRVLNSGQAVIRCDLPGCQPGIPYRVARDAVYFLTRERDQGNPAMDLNGDLDGNDTVVQVFNVRVLRNQVLDDVPAGAPRLPPLPTTFVDGAILFKEVLESDVGRDVNEDGDLNDVVVLVQGDADGDGIFDLADTCVETPDASGADTDVDGLGDVCDPSPTCVAVAAPEPPLADGPLASCQKAIGKGVQKLLKTQLAAARACQDKIVTGKLVAAPAAACRGAVLHGLPLLPGDPATAAKVAKAITKLELAVAKGCASPAIDPLALLDLCANSAGPLVTCLAARTTAATAAVTGLVYGNGGAVTDLAAQKCVKAAGKAAASYVASLFTTTQTCLDRVNGGQIAGGSGRSCVPATASAVPLAPEAPLGDAKTGAKLLAAPSSLGKALAKGCPGAVAAGLQACGDDPAALTSCLTCAGWSAALDLVGAAYGPN